MLKHLKGKSRIIITFSILFTAVAVLLVLIFFAGKKTYIVQFDLDGGTLISGSLEQHVTRGQDATPPVAVKDGAYLHSWSSSYKRVTKDMVISAVWEYETTSGIEYVTSKDQNYAEVLSAYKYINGEVYLGAYYEDKKVLGIRDGAFTDCANITKIYLLDGLIHIGRNAFSGCTNLTEIEIPDTVTHIESGAFKDCISLEKIVLSDNLLKIGSNAFEGCSNLKEIVIPSSVRIIDPDAFAGCGALVIKTSYSANQIPTGWSKTWSGTAQVMWNYVANDSEEESD